MGRWLQLPRTIIPADAVLAPFSILDCDPAFLNQADTGVEVTVNGAGFIDGIVAEISGTGITINSCTFVSETEATLNVDIAADATVGARTLTLTNTYALQASLASALSVGLEAPTLATIDPEEGPREAEGLEITVTGTYFVDGAAVTFSGTGITVNSTTWVSATELTVDIDIAAGATISARNVTVTNPDTQTDVLTAAFEVTLPAPTVVSIDPEEGDQGEEGFVITVTGTGFHDPAVATFSGTGITVNSTTVNSATEIEVDIDIDGAATLSARNITITNPDAQFDTLTAAFTVEVGAAAPTITSITPDEGEQGELVIATIIGTGFVSGCVVTFSEAGIVDEEFNTSFISATELSVEFTVEVSAAVGTCDVTVTNPDLQSDTLVGGFEVTSSVAAMTAAHRTTGVGPLAIVFDAVDVGAGSTAMEQAASGNFNDHDYRWGFDDAGSGNYGFTGGKSKNRAVGHVVAHVFETPGTYDVTCQLIEADGTTTDYQETITVSDPDVVYASTTRYVKTGGSDGASGLDHANAWETVGAALTYLFGGSGRRVLFNRGDTFAVTNATSGRSQTGKTGPFTIGAYGTGANPIWSLSGAASSDTWFDMSTTVTDLRIMDIDGTVASGGGRFWSPGTNSLLLRSTVLNAHRGYFITDGAYDSNVVSGCSFENTQDYGIFTGRVQRFACLDTYIEDSQSSGAGIRTFSYRSCHIGNEYGPVQAGTAVKLLGHASTNSYVCFTDNYVNANTNEPMWITPQSDVNELIDNVLVEGNLFRAPSTNCFYFIKLDAQRVAIRNNVSVHGSNGSDFVTILRIGGSSPVPSGIVVRNNTSYVAVGASAWRIVSQDASVVSATLIANNIGYGVTTSATLNTGSGASTFLTNLAGNPTFVNAAAGDFHLQSGSAARGAGTDNLVRYDYDEVARAGGDGTDQGAFEYVP